MGEQECFTDPYNKNTTSANVNVNKKQEIGKKFRIFANNVPQVRKKEIRTGPNTD